MLLLPTCVGKPAATAAPPTSSLYRDSAIRTPSTRGPNSPLAAHLPGDPTAQIALAVLPGGALDQAWGLRSGLGLVQWLLGGWSGSPGNPTEDGAPHWTPVAMPGLWSSDER
ncbi:hypothetical protein TgHK011_010039 [Trichoderma gracile]|nr:hypothetical protein TgHK011_010039 [Trichoderma gracile]